MRREDNQRRHWIGWAASPVVTIVLLVGVAFTLLVLAPDLRQARLPGNQKGYEPVQPIAFSHRLHAGEMEISCVFCHSGAESSRYAGIPAASTCMNCHSFITAPAGAVRAEDESAQKEGRAPRLVFSPEIRKIYDALGLDEERRPDPHKQPQPIEWLKVYRLADFVFFDHRPHVNAGFSCQTCHGPVETMERVRQVEHLSMGWCVDCHRNTNVAGIDGKGQFTSLPAPAARGELPATHRVVGSIDCSTCHY